MDWRDRLPDEISDVEYTPEGFQAKIEIPQDDEGFFGRGCPACERFFKMRADQWSALPDDAKLTCPYCGECPDDPGDFLTNAQTAYSMSALQAMAEQFALEQIANMFRDLQRNTPRGSGIEITVNDPPPPRLSLDPYVEETVRRVITCDRCGNQHAVYGATAFCPICGPRPAAATVAEAIGRARLTLQLEDSLPPELRDQARDEGVFDRVAEDAIKEVVTLFEVFTRDQFFNRVTNADALTKKLGNVFQRLDDADALFGAHAGFSISSTIDQQTWETLQTVFQQRHVLIHKHGIVDQTYLDRVPSCSQAAGQRLALGRRDAEAALDALQRFVDALSSRP